MRDRNILKHILTSLQADMKSEEISMGRAIEKMMAAHANSMYGLALQQMRDSVYNGHSLTIPMKEYPQLFPKDVVDAISEGEKSGKIVEAFEQALLCLA